MVTYLRPTLPSGVGNKRVSFAASALLSTNIASAWVNKPSSFVAPRGDPKNPSGFLLWNFVFKFVIGYVLGYALQRISFVFFFLYGKYRCIVEHVTNLFRLFTLGQGFWGETVGGRVKERS